jgi:hypothetical protein
MLACRNFNSWSELDDTICFLYKCNAPQDSVSFQPSEPIVLTSELNISLVANANDLNIYGVSGISLYPWLACPECDNMTLSLYFSTIEFYVNHTDPSGYICSPGLIPDDSANRVSLFSSLVNRLFVGHGNTIGSSSKMICPFLFKNSRLDSLELQYQVDSFLYVSLFKFQNNLNKTTETKTINSNIAYLNIIGYNYKLDSGLLHPIVFEMLNDLNCLGTIKSIHTSVFLDLKFLTAITISCDSLGNFYHKIGIEWINYVNIGTRISPMSSIIKYNYPDRDFCIFARFPTNRSIQLVFDDPDPPNCTLTYAWLCKKGNVIFNRCSNLSLNSESVLKQCDIKKRDGKNTQQSNQYLSYPEMYQTRIVSMLFMELVPFVFIPCASMLGLFLNWKILNTIHKNKKKDLKEDFYKYMSVNAKFNCIYCLIFVFYPMTSCNWNQSTYFCSSIFTTQFVQYFKIIIMVYFGEVVKMCANISYLMMTLNRYLLVGKDHASWLVKIAKLEFKWVMCGSLVFSLLINIGHGWEYQAVVDQAILSNDLTSMNYLFLNGYSNSDYPEGNQGQSYFIYSVVYFVINFVFFFVLNTAIEIKIVRRMHKELRQKRKRAAKMGRSKPTSATTASVTNTSQSADEYKEKEDEDLMKERRVIKMVIFNGFFNFVLRSPDIMFWVEYHGSWTTVFGGNSVTGQVNFSQYMPGVLSFVADIAYLAYIITFTTNFFIFYKFNSKFKEAVVFWNKPNPT